MKEKISKKIEKPKKEENKISPIENLQIIDVFNVAAGLFRQEVQDVVHKSPAKADILDLLQKDSEGNYKQRFTSIFKEKAQEFLEKKKAEGASNIEALKKSLREKIAMEFNYLKNLINFNDIV